MMFFQQANKDKLLYNSQWYYRPLLLNNSFLILIGELIPVFEIMTVTPAIRNMIRDHKIPQIDGILYASNKPDMISTDMSLLNLYKEGKITKETALNYATNEEMLKKEIVKLEPIF